MTTGLGGGASAEDAPASGPAPRSTTDNDRCPWFVSPLNSTPYPLLTAMRLRPLPSGLPSSVERTRSNVSGSTAGRPVAASLIRTPAGVIGRPSEAGSGTRSGGGWAVGADSATAAATASVAGSHNVRLRKRVTTIILARARSVMPVGDDLHLLQCDESLGCHGIELRKYQTLYPAVPVWALQVSVPAWNRTLAT